MGSVPLDDVKSIKNHLGVTLNDVVMAVCAGALRRYLEAHDALPTDPLVAMVLSIRSGDGARQVDQPGLGIMARLPTDLQDPVDRVRAMHDTMVAAKEQFDLLPADLIVDLSQFTAPALATRARGWLPPHGSRPHEPAGERGDLQRAGPRQPVYMTGAQMTHYYPVSTITDGLGLNMTVQSYVDTLDFGLVSCRELVPDLWDMLDMCIDEVKVLHRACR